MKPTPHQRAILAGVMRKFTARRRRPRDFETWLSACCGAQPWGEVFVDDKDKTATGICARCKDHCSFDREGDEG